jgi:L-threonylcarbamoyladenylate synthase
VARALAEACGHWITATSANRSGMAPAATVAEMGALAADPSVCVVDGGRTPGGAPSTIVDARGASVELVRAGAVAWSRVLESLQE